MKEYLKMIRFIKMQEDLRDFLVGTQMTKETRWINKMKWARWGLRLGEEQVSNLKTILSPQQFRPEFSFLKNPNKTGSHLTHTHTHTHLP